MKWRDVLDSQKLFPYNYQQCRTVADSANYKFLAFNGLVYSVEDFDMSNPICNDKDLE